ncbi:MAG: dienelactone hydrolase family protein [Alphaproteobacteria bacterium]|nr:MAG: dienelactone hydrolase family protein [Alphaproteobacteria bacterium]
MGEWISLQADDGHALAAYRAQGSDAPKAGLVVIQEIFGVNDHIRSVVEGFAWEGYRVLAPALFDRVAPGIELGYTPDDVARGREIRAQIAHEDALRDVKAAVNPLRAEGLKTGVVGYCWGGSLAWNAATRLEGVGAAVGYYGGMIPDMCDEVPKAPVMLHFGEQDASIPMEGVEKVKAAHPEVPVHVYPAGHGFNCDQRASFDAQSARLARERTLAFLAEHLG